MNLDIIPKNYKSHQIEHLNKKPTHGWVYMDNTKVAILFKITNNLMYPLLFLFCVS